MSVLVSQQIEVHYKCRWCGETFVGKELKFETDGAAQIEITRMQIHLNNLGETTDMAHKSVILHTGKGRHIGVADIIGYIVK